MGRFCLFKVHSVFLPEVRGVGADTGDLVSSRFTAYCCQGSGVWELHTGDLVSSGGDEFFLLSQL